jgi:hypothetical protein
MHVLVTSTLVAAVLLLGTVGRTHAYVHAGDTAAGDCGECRWVKSVPPVVSAVAAPSPWWTVTAEVIAAAELPFSVTRRGTVETRGPPARVAI